MATQNHRWNIQPNSDYIDEDYLSLGWTFLNLFDPQHGGIDLATDDLESESFSNGISVGQNLKKK